MRVNRSPAEVRQIQKILSENMTFRYCFREDWTKNVMEDLQYRMYGKIPRNFILNISGLIGTPTGIFKSSMGLQIAMSLDPMFNIHARVGFSVNNLLDKIQRNSEFILCNRCYYNFEKTFSGSYEMYEDHSLKKCDNCDAECNKLILLTKMIFFLDEQTKTLKRGSLIRLQNIVDTNRQRQLCFITCGVGTYEMNFSTYYLLRLQESHDMYLPKKRVRYCVYDPKREIYYGYFDWNITPLTDPRWNKIWKEYSCMKTDFQRVAISQQIQSLDMEEYAQEIIDSDNFNKCFHFRKNGTKKLVSKLVANLIFKNYPDLTHVERNMILAEIIMMTKQEEEDDIYE